MEEIVTADKKKKGRRRPAAPRVDLTPMVDLGFLLIAFFMFTTTLAKPHTMELELPQVPDPGHASTVYPDTATISLLPISNHQVAWYRGQLKDPGQLHLSDFSIAGVRLIMMQIAAELSHLPPSFSKEAHQLHVLIKPTDFCTYEDVVALLDEMKIIAVPYYAMTDPGTDELSSLDHFVH